ncbi:MAG TPA: Ig-like group 1 domain-containing protein, partial [Burkholderiaceae bacterium]|nr:Ig-like group 1 domain-containing protein [Burkholderiaceae bacterium]
PGNTFACTNEDANYNGVLDAGEDFNGSGSLDPGNVISVSTTGTSSGSSSGTVKTDSTGRATISLIYAESYAPWVQVKLRAEAVVSGTESSKEATFWVTGLASDFSDQTVPPAGVDSPFGENPCNVPN